MITNAYNTRLPLLRTRAGIPYRQEITLNTINRQVGGTTSDCRFIVNNPIKNVHSLRLESCSLPNSFYAIFPTSFIPFYENGSGLPTYTKVYLPAQNYNSSNIAQAVATALTAASTLGATYTCTFDINTGKLTTTTNGGVFQFQWTTADQNMLETGFGMYDNLGFNYINETQNLPDPDTSSVGGSITSSGACQLSVKNLYITVSPVGTAVTTAGANTSTSYIIPVNADFGQWIIFNSGTGYQSDVFVESAGYTLGSINIRVTYSNGSTVDFRGVNASFTFSYLQYEDQQGINNYLF
jgi:hypothetical protein